MSDNDSITRILEPRSEPETGFRLALPQDNQRILELFGTTPMEGNLILATRREPDFFSLYNIQRADYQCVIHDAGEAIDGVSTFIIRDGWIDGQPARLGYLGDLRTGGSARRAVAVARTYGKLFEQVANKFDSPVFLTSIMATNTQAIRALVERKNPKRQDQPYYHLLREFTTVALHFTFPRLFTQKTYQVRTATPDDVAAITELLHSDHQNRLMGYAFDQGEFQHRLDHWPGFTLNNTYLAFDSTGKLVGCTTAWDADAVKRYQILKYRGEMLWVRRFFNTAATVFRFPKLPPEGEVFKYFYFCNISILGESPDIFRALVERIYNDFRKRGYHFATLPMDRNDPLEPALKGFMTRGIDFNLYAVSDSKNPRTDFQSGRTGFEIALA